MKHHDLNELCANQLRMFNQAPMTSKSTLLAAAVETAVEAGLRAEEENNKLVKAIYRTLYDQRDIHGWFETGREQADPNSAMTTVEQIHAHVATQVVEWINEQFNWAIIEAMGLTTTHADEVAALICKRCET